MTTTDTGCAVTYTAAPPKVCTWHTFYWFLIHNSNALKLDSFNCAQGIAYPVAYQQAQREGFALWVDTMAAPTHAVRQVYRRYERRSFSFWLEFLKRSDIPHNL